MATFDPFAFAGFHDPLPPDWEEAFQAWAEHTYSERSRTLAETMGSGEAIGLWSPHMPDPRTLSSLAQMWHQQILERTLWRLMAVVPKEAGTVMFNANDQRPNSWLRVGWQADQPATRVWQPRIEALLREFRTTIGSTKDTAAQAVSHRFQQSFSLKPGGEVMAALIQLQPEFAVHWEHHLLQTAVPAATTSRTVKSRL